MTRFDGYEMTHDLTDEGRLAQQLALSLGATVRASKAKQGYAIGHELVRGEDELARVWEHAPGRPGEVHVVVMGGACDEVVPVLRTLWPGHRVSRVDSAQDFQGGFDELRATALRFAERRKLKHTEILGHGDGDTLYLGARSSEVRVRVYDKSAELRQKHPERASTIPDGIARVELQARPGKRQIKEAAAYLSPDGMWGLGEWTRDFASELLKLDVERVPTHFRRPSNWDRAMHYMGNQWGPLVRARAAEVGSAAALAELASALGLPQ